VDSRPSILGLLETTPARVATPPGPAGVDEPIPDCGLDWRPRNLSRAVTSRRNFRIPVVVLALLIGAAAYAALLAVVRLPVTWAGDQRAAYYHAMDQMAGALPAARSVAQIATDPTVAVLAEHAVPMVPLHATAAALLEAATRPAPPGLALLPGTDLDLLPPLQNRMRGIADSAGDLHATISEVISYRVALDAMFVLPEAPDPAQGRSVDLMADRLFAMNSATISLAATLPATEALAGHRAVVEGLIERLPEWQADYLQSLYQGDQTGAEDAWGAAAAEIAAMRSALEEPLAALAAQLERTITLLERDLAGTMLLVGVPDQRP